MWSILLIAVLLITVQSTPEEFCTALKGKCISQYDRDFPNDNCVDIASLWAIQENDQGNNTLDCRMYHVGVAPDDDSIHCYHAGINGGGVCGSYCENYCFVRSITNGSGCADDATDEECQARCEAIPDTDPTISSNPSVKFATAGNSIQCRIYHAATAFLSDASVHCEHSDFGGGNVCGEYCENYCYFFNSTCSSDEEQYGSAEECSRACAAMNVGANTDTSGASVQCRLYHIGVAAETNTQSIHCPHARFRSLDGICGDGCEHLCEMLDNYCVDDLSLDLANNLGFGANQEQCVDICAGLPEGSTADTTGNSLGCRLYHAEFAVLGDVGTVHCPHAGVAGSKTCGDWCDSYCTQQLESCPNNFEDINVCMQDCAEFAGVDSAAPYVYSDVSADNIQCRVYHVGAAAATGNNVHCDHSSVGGGNVCVAQPTTSEAAGTSTAGGETSEPAETDNVVSLMAFVLALALALL